MSDSSVYRDIPKVDDLLKHEALENLCVPRGILIDAVRETLDVFRKQIKQMEITSIPDMDTVCEEVVRRAKVAAEPSLKTVINATGIPLHTNLGRACISEKAALAVSEVASRYSTLEYDLRLGERGSRHSHVDRLLCKLTGAEAAMVVNNNAAAVLLILSAVGAGGEVVVSRGELVEIGGSFRIPEIMEQCGCKLREVGATNKTHLRDYKTAITAETKALLKVHTSNYRVVGFSESVPLEELVALAAERGLPVVEDLGSGCLVDLSAIGIHDEPTVMESVKAGVDLISFSGDKLLGGPQAGIILGTEKWVSRLKKHPLARALRVDKMTLAALVATLEAYRDPQQAIREIPTLRMLFMNPDQLHARALHLQDDLLAAGVHCEVISEYDQVGGGSVPTKMLSTYAVAVYPKTCSVNVLEERLRRGEQPIIGRIAKDQYLLDLRTIWDDEFSTIVQCVSEAD